MKIITKFGLGFGITLILMSGYFATVTGFIWQQRTVAEKLNQRFLPSMSKFNLITTRIADLRAAMYEAVMEKNLTEEAYQALIVTRDQALVTSVGDMDEILVFLEDETSIIQQLGEFANYYGELDGLTSRTFKYFEARDYDAAYTSLKKGLESFSALKTLSQEIIESLQAATQAQFAELEALSQTFNTVFLVVFALLILGSVSIFILSARNLHSRISQFSKKFAQGAGGDLTVRMSEGQKDELAVIEKNFNQFVAKLQSTLLKIQEISQKTAATSANLSTHSEELSATMEEMNKMVTATSSGGLEMKKKIGDSFQKTMDIEKQIHQVSEKIDAQNNAIQGSSSAVEEITASMSTMTAVIEKRKIATDTLALQAKEGESNMHRTLIAVEEMSTTADKVLGLVRLIEDIAAKTNILALNAAIQAARAGVHGKSFAVVAEEIRKLSETTSKSAADIFGSLQEIREKITATREITNVTEISSVAIFSGMQEVSQGMGEILISIQELTTGGTQIRESLSALVQDSGLIATASQTIALRSKEVEVLMSQTLQVTEDNALAIAQTSTGVEEINLSTIYLRDQAIESREQTTVLDAELARFKL